MFRKEEREMCDGSAVVVIMMCGSFHEKTEGRWIVQGAITSKRDC